MFSKFLFFGLMLLITAKIPAADDSVYVVGKYLIVGEIKGMGKGVLTIETDYSDSDFKIEWSKVGEIYSKRLFILTTSSGKRYYGTIRSDKSDKSSVIIAEESNRARAKISDIVFINQVDKDFLSRLSASLDLGFSLAKTNNLLQFSLRTNIGYLTDAWSADVSYSGVRSSQDNIDPTKRNEGSLNFRYFLPYDWFVFISNSLLQNDEQKLKLRSISQAGLGNYIIRTNSMYLAADAGVAWNNETYTDPEIDNRSSSEGLVGLELNIFNMGDLDFVTTLTVYPSFSEKGRIRADYKADLKYDLPFDLYINLGYTYAVQNKRAEALTSVIRLITITNP